MDKPTCLVCEKMKCNCDPRLQELLNFINSWAKRDESKRYGHFAAEEAYSLACSDIWEKVSELFNRKQKGEQDG